MSRFGWFTNLFGTSQSRKDRRQPQQRRVRLSLEQLEDRVTPSQTLFPATQVTVMEIEIQIFKQIPYMLYWNNYFQQNYGMPLPGVAQFYSALEAQFPQFATFAHF